MTVSQVLRRQINDLRLATMGIDNHQAVDAAGCKTGADLPYHGQQGFRLMGEGSRERGVFAALADGERGQHQNRA